MFPNESVVGGRGVFANRSLPATRGAAHNADGKASSPAVRALVQLGDWLWWHNKRERAKSSWAEAWEEYSGLTEEEQSEINDYSQPMALPDLDGRNWYPEKGPAGSALLAHGVDVRGRAVNIELLEMIPEEASGKSVKVLRYVKKIRFRPALLEGVPVAIERIERRYGF